MIGELSLDILQAENAVVGDIAAFVVTDERIVAASEQAVVISADLRRWDVRPAQHGLRSIVAIGDAIWGCGDAGLLAVTRDHGATWTRIATHTHDDLRAIAFGPDGALWVVGDHGYAARWLGEQLRRVEIETAGAIVGARTVRDEMVLIGADGALRRWRDGSLHVTATGGRVAGLCALPSGAWIVVGADGFIARSPDGWAFASIASHVEHDLAAVAVLADGSIVAVGAQTILRSVDEGRSWRTVSHPFTGRLASVVRFGRGVLLGGERGLVAKLAPPDDTTWAERADEASDRPSLAVLVDELAATQPAQIAALAQLDELYPDELAIALPAVAASLSPEAETLLVEAILRGEEASPDEDVPAPGWDAIDEALQPIYGDAQPLRFGTVLPYALGGEDPIHSIAVYTRETPVPHWHFVTYGFTDLFHPESEDLEESGFGFELTFRLAKASSETRDAMPPTWALNFLQNLGRYVFETGNRFAAGHKMGLNGPIALDRETPITAVCFADDPELGDFASEFGTARFVQIVGITDDEYQLVQEWSTTGLVEILQGQSPLLVTDLQRRSVLADPAIAATVAARVTNEGSSEDLTFAGELTISADDGRVRMELGALYAAALPRAMRGRIRHGRPYELHGSDASVSLEPSAVAGYRYEQGSLILDITQALATEIEQKLAGGLAGSYRFDAWPALEIVVTPSFITDREGTVIEVRGIEDPEVAQQLLARATAGDTEEPAEALDPAKVRAASALTERALRLAPHDPDVQHTHALLVLALDGDIVELVAKVAPVVRVDIAIRMGEAGHARFADVVDQTLGAPFEDVGHEACLAFGSAIIAHAPSKLGKLVPHLPDDVTLLSELAWRAVQAKHRDAAIALYERVLALPIPQTGDERTNYLRVLNNACVQAHAAKAFDAAVRIADFAQPVAHENPYIFHSAACAYAAVGDYGRALEQVRKAIEYDYDHLAKVEVDRDLGTLLDSPEFKALFRDWHARREGN